MTLYPPPDRDNKCPDGLVSVQIYPYTRHDDITACRFPCGTLGRDQSTGECNGAYFLIKWALLFSGIFILAAAISIDEARENRKR